MAAQGQVTMDPAVVDDIIRRLTEVRSARPGKQVQLSEAEIKQLCVSSRDIFFQQPNLLELSAPIKICGTVYFVSHFCYYNYIYILNYFPLLLLLFSSSFFEFLCE